LIETLLKNWEKEETDEDDRYKMTILQGWVRHEGEEKEKGYFLTEEENESGSPEFGLGTVDFVGVTLYGADGRCSACVRACLLQ
jgi:hypothetical protein